MPALMPPQPRDAAEKLASELLKLEQLSVKYGNSPGANQKAELDQQCKQFAELCSKVCARCAVESLLLALKSAEAAAVRDARYAPNDWRTTARHLGQADGLEKAKDLATLLALFLKEDGPC